MKPVLYELHGLTWPIFGAIVALAVVLVGVWLAVARRRGPLTRDHSITAAVVLGMTLLALFILNAMPAIRINAYGAMLTVGFILGTFTAIRLGMRRGIAPERLLDLGLFVLVGAIIGARVAYVMITPDAGPLFDVNLIMAKGLGGLSFHGGLIGGLLAATGYILATKQRFWLMADCTAPGIALGYAITRVGCFLNGCCFGKPAENLPWAVTFPSPVDNGPIGPVPPFGPIGQIAYVHPVQLYATFMALAMFGILLLLSRGQSLGRAGRLFMVFLVLEGVERFVMEIYRFGDTGGVVTPAQFVSALLVVAGVIGWFTLPKQPAVLPDASKAEQAAAE
jgi:phosphatidylglycerol:prolipoprotein diacylglycerol transferase